MLKIKKIHHQAMDMNSYVLFKNHDAIVIDPGMNGAGIKAFLNEKSLNLNAVLLTHGHFDHIRDIHILKEDFSFEIYIHEKDLPMLYDSTLNYAKAFNQHFILDRSMRVNQLHDQSMINILGEEIQVIHTPGHTDGSVMYQYKQVVFSGDTLFYDSIGRTDLFSGNFNAIRRSIKKINSELSNGLSVHPGHGRSGTLKEIKKVNRFLSQ